MGETILITGASRGIGKQMALIAQERRYSVLGTVRNPDVSDLPAPIRTYELDVTEQRSCARLAAEIPADPVDILVCNAGVYFGRGGMDDAVFDATAWQQSMMTNVAGVFFTVQALLPKLRASARPRIAIIASRMGSNAASQGGGYIYRASKAAAINLATNFAHDLAGDGIAVAAYHPGWVRTDMGGDNADIDATESATALMNRFEEMAVAPGGQFFNFDGTPLPY